MLFKWASEISKKWYHPGMIFWMFLNLSYPRWQHIDGVERCPRQRDGVAGRPGCHGGGSAGGHARRSPAPVSLRGRGQPLADAPSPWQGTHWLGLVLRLLFEMHIFHYLDMVHLGLQSCWQAPQWIGLVLWCLTWSNLVHNDIWYIVDIA